MSVVNRIEDVARRCQTYLRNPLWFCVLCVVILLGITSRGLSPDLDLFHRLATGKLITTSDTFPYRDPFSFSETLPMWIDHEWLSGVLFYRLHETFGDSGLLCLRAFLFACTTVLVVSCSAHLTPLTPGILAWILLCLFHGSFGWSSVIRCQAFTYLFVPLLLLGCIRVVTKESWILLLTSPLILVAWCNLHGGFVLGLIILALFVAHQFLYGGRWIRALFILGASVAATALNPYGFTAYWRYLIEALSMPRPEILEWKPLLEQPDQYVATIGISAVLLLGVAVAFLHRRKTSVTLDMSVSRSSRLAIHTLLFFAALLALSSYSAFRHSRFLVFYMVTAAAVGAPFIAAISTIFAPAIKERAERLSRVWGISAHALAGVALFSLGFGATDRTLLTLNYDSYPIEALDHLESTSTSGKLLVDFNFGAYSLWRLYPKFLVSMDSRYETAYTVSAVNLNYRALTPAGERERSQLSPTHILLSRSSSAGGRRLTTDGASSAETEQFFDGWGRIYSDDNFTLLAKNP